MRKAWSFLSLCIALLLAVVTLPAQSSFFSRAKQKPNIVVILADTLRPDHLGVYGYARDTSPTIDALAMRGKLFTSAYSVSNWTNPAIKSIFTGLSPQAVMREAWHKEAIRMPLPKEVTTFAELTQTRGYRTAALVDHPGIGKSGQYDQGFESFQNLYRKGANGNDFWTKSDVDYVTSQFDKRLSDYSTDPFLIYIHVTYPHRPYRPPASYQGLFGPDSFEHYSESMIEPVINAYDTEIRRTDDLVAGIDRTLASRGLLENTWIIFLSDHGEGFWEHGFAEHGNVFYDEIIRIPLIVVPPKGRKSVHERVDEPVSNLDVFATILDIANVPVPEGTMGTSLLGKRSSAGRGSQRILFSESAHSYDIEARTVIRDGLKYSNYPERPEPYRNFLFDLRTDPLEQVNLFGTRADIEKEMQQLLADHKAQSELEREWLVQKIVTPDDRTLEALKSLGYTQ